MKNLKLISYIAPIMQYFFFTTKNDPNLHGYLGLLKHLKNATGKARSNSSQVLNNNQCRQTRHSNTSYSLSN